MDVRRIELSLPIAGGTLPDPEVVVPVFHAWIRDRAIDEVLVDVARYGHVADGPAVMLVGHSGDWAIERSGSSVRLAAVRKRGAAPPADRLADAARRLFEAAGLLEAAVPGLRFETNELRLRFLDRLAAPNTTAAFADLTPEVERFMSAWLGPITLERIDEPGEPLALRIRRQGREPVGELRARLPAPPTA
jgi:hypothetical protein